MGLLKNVGTGIFVSFCPSLCSFLQVGVVLTEGVTLLEVEAEGGSGDTAAEARLEFRLEVASFTHWVVKSSNISLGSSLPSAARWSSTLDL